jgi:diaminopimelate epimerase
MELFFSKMHGLGNDFVVLFHEDGKSDLGFLTPAFTKKMCDRHFGIGADQILCLVPALNPQNTIRMLIYNADGSTAEMCGNGIRAATLFLHQRFNQKSFRIETQGGLFETQIEKDQITTRLAYPQLKGTVELIIGTQPCSLHLASVGNPHAVLFSPDLSSLDWKTMGPLIENHPFFPHRTNVEFVQRLSSQKLLVAVWERGAGATLACGSGACAVFAVAYDQGFIEEAAQIVLPGGTLDFQKEGLSLVMKGPAELVYSGKYFF